MTPSAQLERLGARLGALVIAVLIVQLLLSGAQRKVLDAAERMGELEEVKGFLELENERLHRGLDGALAYIHQNAGSELDRAFDSQGSEPEGSLDTKGSIQPDQG